MLVRTGVEVGSVSSISSGLGGMGLVLVQCRLEGETDLVDQAWDGVGVGASEEALNRYLWGPAWYGVGDQFGAGWRTSLGLGGGFCPNAPARRLSVGGLELRGV